MWDRPDILNRISSALFVVAAVLVAYALFAFAVQLPVFALAEIKEIVPPRMAGGHGHDGPGQDGRRGDFGPELDGNRGPVIAGGTH